MPRQSFIFIPLYSDHAHIITHHQHRLSTPLLLTHRYFTPLYGLTPSPNPRLRLGSRSNLSTLIPLGNQPRTENETETEVGINDA